MKTRLELTSILSIDGPPKKTVYCAKINRVLALLFRRELPLMLVGFSTYGSEKSNLLVLVYRCSLFSSFGAGFGGGVEEAGSGLPINMPAAG